MPPVVALLLAGNVLMFVLQNMLGDGLERLFALWPYLGPEMKAAAQGLPHFAPWQLLTYAFLHGNLTHLLFNMFALWMFGSRIEQCLRSARFAYYYFFCVVGAGLLQLFIATQAADDGKWYSTVGASGGVFGLLLAFGMMFPNERIMLLFPPIPMKAKWFVLIYGLVELVMGVTGTLAGVAHFAHLGGMLFGLLLILYWRGRLPWRPRTLMGW